MKRRSVFWNTYLVLLKIGNVKVSDIFPLVNGCSIDTGNQFNKLNFFNQLVLQRLISKIEK
jgi:hypothetical protein